MSEVRLNVPDELRNWHRREHAKLHEVSETISYTFSPGSNPNP